MNTRASTPRREEEGVANARIPPCVCQVPIVGLEEENEEIPIHEPQVPLKSQELQVPPMPQAPFV